MEHRIDTLHRSSGNGLLRAPREGFDSSKRDVRSFGRAREHTGTVEIPDEMGSDEPRRACDECLQFGRIVTGIG